MYCKEAPAAGLADAGGEVRFFFGGVLPWYAEFPAVAVAGVTVYGEECVKLIVCAGTHFSGVCS